jgi:hypothetical protein
MFNRRSIVLPRDEEVQLHNKLMTLLTNLMKMDQTFLLLLQH